MEIKEKVITEIKKIYDPEIPVNIYELGLIYDVTVDKDNKVYIKMTLTTPNCPVAESLPNEVKNSIKEIKDVILPRLCFRKPAKTLSCCSTGSVFSSHISIISSSI